MSIEGKHFYRFTYLKSEEWHTARIVALARAEATCVICGKQDWRNDAHHRKYPDDIWKTNPFHLIVLCRECHEDLHRLSRDRGITQWSSQKRRLKQLKRLKASIAKQIPDRCFFCHATERLYFLKKASVRSIFTCDDCIPGLIQTMKDLGVKRVGWRVLDAAKEKIKWSLPKRFSPNKLDLSKYYD